MPPTRTCHKSNTPAKPHQQKLISKELDLLLLAGCSCLLILIHHPISEALQSSQTVGGSQLAIETQVGKASSNSLGSIHLFPPPKRDEITDED